MGKETKVYSTETVYGNYSFASKELAVAFEQLAYKAMFDYDLGISLIADNCVLFKLNNRYDLELNAEGCVRLVEHYDPEPCVSIQKVLYLLDLYEKGFVYTLNRGVAIVELKEQKDLESDFKKYIQFVKK